MIFAINSVGQNTYQPKLNTTQKAREQFVNKYNVSFGNKSREIPWLAAYVTEAFLLGKGLSEHSGWLTGAGAIALFLTAIGHLVQRATPKMKAAWELAHIDDDDRLLH